MGFGAHLHGLALRDRGLRALRVQRGGEAAGARARVGRAAEAARAAGALQRVHVAAGVDGHLAGSPSTPCLRSRLKIPIF